MHKQTASELLYDVSHFTINKKVRSKKYVITLNMSEYKSIIFFLYYIRMEPTNQNNDINVTQETRQLFNEPQK